MHIYILDYSSNKTDALMKYFGNEPDVEIVNDEFSSFMDHHQVECVVSPANSFGLMDGAYDAAITACFGEALQKKVQNYILDHFRGYQPVGSSFIIPIDGTDQKLIHTPTMVVPGKIRDPFLISQCMRMTLTCAIENGIKSIVIPVFGGQTGQVEASVCAKEMWLGYRHAMYPNTKISWDIAYEIADGFSELDISIE